MTSHVQRPRVRRVSPALLLAASVALTACGPDDLLSPGDSRPTAIQLTTNSSAALASFGDTAVITPRVLDESGRTLQDVRLRWSVSPAGILERDGEGIYRAIANGRVTIVAEIDPGATGVRPGGYWVGPRADTVVVEVRQRAARLVFAPVDTAFATLGAVRRLQAHVTDARGNSLVDAPPPLRWQSADPGVATVDSTGAVRSRGEGTVLISVQADSLTRSTTFLVRPRLPHTSCMTYALRRQPAQACVTLGFILREREAGR